MIKEFEKLTRDEAALLIKAPVIFSAHELSVFKNISKAQKEDAVKLIHTKTFSEHPLLVPYYEEAEKDFKTNFEAYVEQCLPFDPAHCDAIKNDMDKINSIIDKLDNVYGTLLRKSLQGYSRHVKNAAHSVFQDIIFPVTFSKL